MSCKEMNASKLMGLAAVVVCVLILVSGCEFTQQVFGPRHSEYEGVWACYKMKTDETEFEPKDIDDVVTFLALKEDGRAEMIIRLPGDDPSIIDCRWDVTFNDREKGEEAGIILIGEDFVNPYSYVYYPGETALAEERLIDGDLRIDYGYREEYLEKISDNFDFQPWMTDTSASLE